MEPAAETARSKAAAWAWYQRGSGSMVALPAARSEASLATPHRRVCGSPSRFKLEADLLLSIAPITDTSDRFERLHLSTNSSNASCDYGALAADMSKSSTQQVNVVDSYPSTCTDLVIAGSSSYGAAAWDCGSVLFDSFELVSLSKKLDDAHQLNDTALQKICPPADDTVMDTQFGMVYGKDDEEEEEELEDEHTGALRADTSSRLKIKGLPRLGIISETIQSLRDQKRSRQAIYDMFCRYDNPVPQAGIFKDVNHCSSEHTKKPKPPMSPVARSKQYRRRRLHRLSKAFRQISQLAGLSQASSMPIAQSPEKGHLRQSLSLPVEALVQPRPHYHKIAKAASGSELSSSPFQECPPLDSCGIKASNNTLRKHYSSDYVHHHHHHHYHHHHHHYLFGRHSDEGFGVPPEPLLGADKSLLVAAAGLRTANLSSLQDYLSLNPKLEGAFLDYKRKLKDPNMPASSPIQFPSPPNLQV